jgi:hypothetical protein
MTPVIEAVVKICHIGIKIVLFAGGEHGVGLIDLTRVMTGVAG